MNPSSIMQDAVTAALAETLRTQLDDPTFRSVLEIKARAKKLQYDAYVRAGFSPSDAILLTVHS